MCELPIHFHFSDKFQLEANDINNLCDFSDTSCELFLNQPQSIELEKLSSVYISQPIRNLKQSEGINSEFFNHGFIFPSLLEVQEERILDGSFISTEIHSKDLAKNNKSLKTERKNQKQYALQTRNALANFATNLVFFIEFQIQKAILAQNDNKIQKLYQLKFWISQQKSKMRKLLDWKMLFEDPIHGELLKHTTKCYFGKSFAESYVLHSKITKEYKEKYYACIKKYFRQFFYC